MIFRYVHTDKQNTSCIDESGYCVRSKVMQLCTGGAPLSGAGYEIVSEFQFLSDFAVE